MSQFPVIEGKMFGPSYVDEQEFYRHGVGAMQWIEIDGHRVLLVLLPTRAKRKDGKERIWDSGVLYVNRQPNNWSAPGEVNGWDGDEERPTLNPSISHPYPGGWHGYIRAGSLETVEFYE